MGCRNAAVLNAPSERVWNTLRNFHDGSWAPNVIESIEAVGDAGPYEPGARRVLNGAFHETLHDLDEEGRTLRYSIDEGPGPLEEGKVTGYFGEVSVFDVTPGDGESRSVVVWTSDWDTEEGGVHDFCDPIYKALLTDMKAHFG